MLRRRFPTFWGDRTAAGAKAVVLGLLAVPPLPLLLLIRLPSFSAEPFERDRELTVKARDLRLKKSELSKTHGEEYERLKAKRDALEKEGPTNPLQDLIRGSKLTPEEKKRRADEAEQRRQARQEIAQANERYLAESKKTDALIAEADEERRSLGVPDSRGPLVAVLVWFAVVNVLAWLSGRPQAAPAPATPPAPEPEQPA